MSDKQTIPDEAGRRFSLKALVTLLLSGLVGVFPVAAGVGVLLHPIKWIRRLGNEPDPPDQPSEADVANWIPVTSLNSVPSDGTPRLFPVVTDVVDAWTRTPNTAVGAVFLSRAPVAAGEEKAKDEAEVVAFQADCPHLGCRIDWSSGEKIYTCPCHVSGFGPDGEKLYGPSLRGLDPLEVKLVANGEDRQVVVKFAKFRASVAERIAVQ